MSKYILYSPDFAVNQLSNAESCALYDTTGGSSFLIESGYTITSVTFIRCSTVALAGTSSDNYNFCLGISGSKYCFVNGFDNVSITKLNANGRVKVSIPNVKPVPSNVSLLLSFKPIDESLVGPYYITAGRILVNVKCEKIEKLVVDSPTTVPGTKEFTLRTEGIMPIANEGDAYNIGSAAIPYHNIYHDGAVFNVSDKREKTDVKRLNDVLLTNSTDLLSDMEPIIYRLTKNKNFLEDDAPFSIGLIAQDVEEVLKKHFGEKVYKKINICLHDQVSDRYNLAYQEIIGILVNSIRELNDRVKRLESHLK